jgi:hypothetical protein
MEAWLKPGSLSFANAADSLNFPPDGHHRVEHTPASIIPQCFVDQLRGSRRIRIRALVRGHHSSVWVNGGLS